jgi:hypothetical protein
MNPFPREVVRLPPPSIASHFIDAYSKSLPIVNGSGVVHCIVNVVQYVLSFSKVVLSASPDSGSKSIVAAFSVCTGVQLSSPSGDLGLGRHRGVSALGAALGSSVI